LLGGDGFSVQQLSGLKTSKALETRLLLLHLRSLLLLLLLLALPLSLS
jgi:hypothetical protein